MRAQKLHGGDLYKICDAYGLKKEDLLDFSANINPLGISPIMKEILISNIDNLINYPDPECNELREALSKFLGVGKEAILAGNGASEVIFLLFEVLKPRKVLIPAPCFAEYARAASAGGTEVLYYELKEKDGFRLKVEDFLQHITEDMDTVLLCNPNNPTSALISKSDLLKIIEFAYSRNVTVIIDEAFIELTLGGNKNSVSEYLHSFKNLFIIRALTKIMAIPGLRLGYVIGDREILERMWERKLPWSVNSFACSIGKVLTEDGRYLEETAKWLGTEKKHLYEELSRIPQIKVFEPDTNFILIKLLEERLNSVALKENLIRKGILIRDASNFKYLNDRFIRVAVKDRKSNELLVRALRDC